MPPNLIFVDKSERDIITHGYRIVLNRRRDFIALKFIDVCAIKRSEKKLLKCVKIRFGNRKKVDKFAIFFSPNQN